jgi:lactoylglutathione lyase
MINDGRLDPIVGIEHIALATQTVERLLDFYKHLWAEASPLREDAETGLRSCALDFCGVRLELIERPAGEGQSSSVGIGFALGSADAVDELTRRLAAAGHRVLEPPRRSCAEGCYESLVLDPDGNRITLTV